MSSHLSEGLHDEIQDEVKEHVFFFFFINEAPVFSYIMPRNRRTVDIRQELSPGRWAVSAKCFSESERETAAGRQARIYIYKHIHLYTTSVHNRHPSPPPRPAHTRASFAHVTRPLCFSTLAPSPTSRSDRCLHLEDSMRS